MLSQQKDVKMRLQDFYQESTKLLENGIRAVFKEELERLSIPPQRMAKLIRILLEGLLMELAQIQNEEQLEQLDQAYADIRTLFERFVLSEVPNNPSPISDQDIVLPW